MVLDNLRIVLQYFVDRNKYWIRQIKTYKFLVSDIYLSNSIMFISYPDDKACSNKPNFLVSVSSTPIIDEVTGAS